MDATATKPTNRMKVFRVMNGWSQTDLAVRSGISRPTIAKMEKGKETSMGYKNMEKVADAFGRSVQDVFFPESEKKPRSKEVL